MIKLIYKYFIYILNKGFKMFFWLTYVKDNMFTITLVLSIIFIVTYGLYNIMTNKTGTWSSNFMYIPPKEGYLRMFTNELFKKANGFMSKSGGGDMEQKSSIVTTSSLNVGDSKGEMECRRVLEELFQKPFPKCRPNFLRNCVTGNEHNLELDCFNEEMRLAVEYDGIGHYRYTPYFHKSKEAFYNQRYRDYMKDNLCKQNNVILIRVPYFVKHENIRDYLIKKLKSI